MSNAVSIGVILRNLRSIKLAPDKRKFVNDTRVLFERTGDIPLGDKVKLRRLYSRYSIQINELERARERARHTNARLRMGMTQAEVERRIKERKDAASGFGI